MIGLIVIIVACVMTYNEAKRLNISSALYIIATILLGIVPSILVHVIIGKSLITSFISMILTVVLCFIPYNRLKNRIETNSKNEEDKFE